MTFPFDDDSEPEDRINGVQNRPPVAGHQTQATDIPDESFRTQPTQILDTPHKIRLNGNLPQGSSSPLVQVAASSPVLSAQKASNPVSSTVQTRPEHPMAPPGTQFRHPSQVPPAGQSQPQTQPLDLDENGAYISDSSDAGDDGKLLPSVFSKGSRSNGPTRVSDSPQSNSTFGDSISRFSYNQNSPFKRAAPDDSVSAYASHRSSKMPRVNTPSRRPRMESDDMKIEDIDDYNLREKARNLLTVLPSASVFQSFSALIKKRGHYEDALDYLATQLDEENETPRETEPQNPQNVISLVESDDELSQQNSAKKTVKRNVKNGVSINAKYGLQAQAARRAPEQPKPPPKRRLKSRPRQNMLVFSSQESAHAEEKEVHPMRSDSGSDHGKSDVSQSDSEDEIEIVSETGQAERLLGFINTRSMAELQDLSNMSDDIVSAVIAARPFRKTSDICDVPMVVGAKGKRKAKTTAVGDRFFRACDEIWTGYESLDRLVDKCEEYGGPIFRAMKEWGLASFGSSENGELDMTVVKAEDIATYISQPGIMSSSLVMKDYQVAGLNWLALLYNHGLSAILADDMGLGKTCQVIAFLAYLKEQGKAEGLALIIVPGSTLENWLRELENFCPALSCTAYYGPHNERPDIQIEIEAALDDIDVVVTTYDTAAKPGDAKFLRKLKPAICVYDEAHQLRNSATAKYQQLMRIPTQRMRLLLTGTPLQNNLSELGSLLGFLMPDLFREHAEDLQKVFKQRAKVQTMQKKDAPEGEKVHDELLSEERIRRARSMLTPFILRRKKDQVLKELPKKTNSVMYCVLEDEHKEIYDDIITKYSRSIDVKGEKKGTDPSQSNVLVDMRKAAIHPLLFRRRFRDKEIKVLAESHAKYLIDHGQAPPSAYDKKLQLAFEYWEGLSDFEIHRQIMSDGDPKLQYLTFKDEPWMASAKVQALLELLDKHNKEGHTTIIFSQFVLVMNILEAVFETREIPFFRLDGSTAMQERQQIIDTFTAESKDPTSERRPVFMLSTKAGGQGINLTAANRVIIFDSGFNPQDDVQAENRAHRVGQTREVEIVRLIAKNTIEEPIYVLGQRKLKLDNMVAGTAGAPKSELDAEKDGAALVEKLVAEQVKAKKEGKEANLNVKLEGDMGESFMKGLKSAGLDMSAAARKPLKRGR